MGKFSGKREWETLYDGWDLADAIVDLNFVRSDGKTLIPQPHLRFDDKDMWTRFTHGFVNSVSGINELLHQHVNAQCRCVKLKL